MTIELLQKLKSTLLLFALCVVGNVVQAQTTINTTVGSTGYTGSNSGGTNYGITFVINNTTSSPIFLTDVADWTSSLDNGKLFSLYYSSTSLGGTPATTFPATGWTLIDSNTVSGISSSTLGVNTVISGMTFLIPGNTMYRFSLVTSGTRRYSGTGVGTASPDSFSANGITLYVGDYQINGGYVGYGATNNPRFFTGSITFVPAGPCTSPPTAGATNVSNHAPCLNQNVTLSLSGTSIGTGQTYQWESATSAAGPYTPISGATSIGYIATSSTSGTTYYRAAVTCSGQTAYSSYDSVVVPVAFPGGTYTIDSSTITGGSNFQSFTEAVSAISCGISGPVTFNVVPGSGPYEEQITLPGTIGASATNTVTFNGNGDTLTSSSTTLNLDGADYITFNNLVINATGSAGFAVHLMNDADHNTFDSCSINADPTSTSSSSAGVSMSGSTTSYSTQGANGSFNTFSYCTITGGYWGFVAYGSGATGNSNNDILHCTIQDFYYYGCYNYQQGSGTISDNIVERPNRSSVSSFYGIVLSTGCTDMTVANNRVRNAFGGNPGYSGTIYALYCTADGTAGNENLFYNNVVSEMNGNSTLYCMYLSGADYVQVYHNTLSLDYTAATTSSATYGIYSTGTTGIDIENNLISITRGGTGTKYGLYYSGGGKTSDYNDIYVNSAGGNNNIGYYSGAQATLAAWQAVNGGIWDQNSVDVDPMFVSPSTGDFTPSNSMMDNAGTPIALVTTDITGAARNATTPDIGAYEFSVPPCTGNPVAGTASGPATACSNAPITLTLTGFTIGSGITIQWQESPAGAGFWSDITGATTGTYTVSTGITSPTDYQAIITCSNGGATDVSNTVSVGMSPFYLCYCSPLTGVALHTNGYNYLTNVNITATALNNTSTVVGGGGYTQYYPTTASTTTSLTQGIQYTLNGTAQYTNYPISAWIDYNGDGSMDSSEYVTMTPDASGYDYSGTFIIPYTSVTGNTGLRVRLGYNPGYNATQACYNYSSGYETEDYIVNVIAAPTCSGTPNAGVAFAADSVCPGTAFLLSDTAYSYGQGITYQWQESPAGAGFWTDITGATNPSYTVAAGITTATDYQLVITCTNGGATNTSNSISIGISPYTQCYCTPLYTTACTVGDDIDDVILTGDLAPGINNLNTPCPTGGYADYTTMSATVSPGLTYSGNVTTNYSSASEDARIWIDYNLDGIFQGTEEIAALDNLSNTSTGAFTFTVPVTTPLGSYRMRVRLVYAASGGGAGIDPCSSETYGEAHDYTINVTAPPTCMPVTGVTTGTVLFNSAVMTWNQSTSAPANGYLWEVFPQGSGPSGTPLATGVEPAGDTAANITGLSASTAYSFYVRALCSTTDSSFWANGSFATPCSTAVAPYVETFTGSSLPNCWTAVGTGTSGWQYSQGSGPDYDALGSTEHTGNGGYFAWVDGSYVSGGASTSITSPVIDISSLTAAQLRYYVVSYNPTYTAANGNNKLIVSGWNGTSWVTLDSIQQSLPQGWNERTISLSSLGAVTTTQIRYTFTATASTAFYNDILIDDIYVENAPTCPTPTLITTSNATANSIDVNWTENGSATNWQIEYGPTGFTQGTGTLTGNITAKPYTLSLVPAGAYDVYVRSICGPNDTSTWSIPALAATLPGNDSCAFAIDITNGTTVTGYTSLATQSMPPCDATPVANDVWYSFTTGSISGSVTVTAVSTIADLVLQVFSGTCSGTLTAMTPTASSAPTLQPCIDGPAAGTEYGTFTVAPFTTYLVRVYGYNGSQGTFGINALGAPLAIKLSKIDATNLGAKNRVDWSTESELKSDKFELERSADGRNFSYLAGIAAKGEASTYSYVDEKPVTGINYYRLKMIDAAGVVTTSKVVTATVKQGAFTVEAYPNPVSEKLTIEVYGGSDQNATVAITDVTGKVMKVVNVVNGKAEVNMNGLASGVYLVKYTDNNHSQTIKVNKQ